MEQYKYFYIILVVEKIRSRSYLCINTCRGNKLPISFLFKIDKFARELMKKYFSFVMHLMKALFLIPNQFFVDSGGKEFFFNILDTESFFSEKV